MNKNIKVGIVAVVILAALTIVGSVVLNQPAYAFKVDVNPSIEIKANRLNRVVEINPLNEDAEKLLKDFKLEDRDLEDAIEDLADLMVLKGYISGGKDNLVMITVEDEVVDKKAVDDLNRVIAAYLENKQIEATIVNQSTKTSVDGGKTGKEIAASRINKLDDGLSLDELMNMSLKDLVRYAESNNIDTEKLFTAIVGSIETDEIENEISNNGNGENKIIPKGQAEKIALGVVDGKVLEVELDDYDDLYDKDDDDNPEYEIKVLGNDGKKYEIEIDALTGKVLEVDLEDDDDDDYKDKKKVKAPKNTNNKKNNTKAAVNNTPKRQIISADQAKQIALGLVNGKIVEFELDDDDDDDAEYKIEIIADGKEYEIEIDAYTGKVLEFEVDDIDNDDDDD